MQRTVLITPSKSPYAENADKKHISFLSHHIYITNIFIYLYIFNQKFLQWERIRFWSEKVSDRLLKGFERTTQRSVLCTPIAVHWSIDPLIPFWQNKVGVQTQQIQSRIWAHRSRFRWWLPVNYVNCIMLVNRDRMVSLLMLGDVQT